MDISKCQSRLESKSFGLVQPLSAQSRNRHVTKGAMVIYDGNCKECNFTFVESEDKSWNFQFQYFQATFHGLCRCWNSHHRLSFLRISNSSRHDEMSLKGKKVPTKVKRLCLEGYSQRKSTICQLGRQNVTGPSQRWFYESQMTWRIILYFRISDTHEEKGIWGKGEVNTPLAPISLQ